MLTAVILLLLIALALFVWAVSGLVQEHRQQVRLARRRALIRQQQARAEQRLDHLATAAFAALVDEAQRAASAGAPLPHGKPGERP